MRTEIEAGVRTEAGERWKKKKKKRELWLLIRNLKERRVSSSPLHVPLITTCWHEYSSCSCRSERKGRRWGERKRERERERMFGLIFGLHFGKSPKSYKSRAKYQRQIPQIAHRKKTEHSVHKQAPAILKVSRHTGVTLGLPWRRLQQSSAAFPETGVMGNLTNTLAQSKGNGQVVPCAVAKEVELTRKRWRSRSAGGAASSVLNKGYGK